MRAFFIILFYTIMFLFPYSYGHCQQKQLEPPQKQHKLSFLHDSVSYLWPTNSSTYMSATFGETRSSHFHAALDIKTWGRRGYDVFATRDAILHRVGITANGYGNVIYLKHNDGSYSVYAHLMDFIPKIRHLVDSLRMKEYTFEFNRNMEDFDIRFQKGDLIGQTGSSGIGPPHLHFELRTPDHHPFNPLLTNIDVKDNRPPRFSGLSVEPLSQNAYIERGKKIIKRRPAWHNGYYDFGTINVQGTVGLGVDVFDQADKVANVYAVYELSLSDEQGTTWFHSQVDSFSYDNTHQMFIDRVYPILKESRKGYQRLYIADGNTLPFYKETKNRGRLNLKPGEHTLYIKASDFHGNSSKAKVKFNVTEPDKQESFADNWQVRNPQKLISTNGNITILPSHWSDNWIAAHPKRQPALQTASLFSFSQTISPNVTDANQLLAFGTTHTQPMQFQIDSTEILLHRVLPGEKSVLYSSDQRMQVVFNQESIYDTLSIGIDYRLLSDSIRIDVSPHIQPLKGDLDLELLLDTTQIRLKNPHVYWYNERRDSYYLQPTKTKDNIVSAKLKSFGTHYVLSDTTKPTIERARLYRAANNRLAIAVRVNDDLSGIDYTRSQFYCNGKRGIAEYDPYTKQLSYYRPNFEPKPKNVCSALVYDVAGNKEQYEFTIRR